MNDRKNDRKHDRKHDKKHDQPAQSSSSSPAAVTHPQDEATQDVTHGVEKFSAADLNLLRSDLLRSGVDSFQAAEIVTGFLTGRGYGCSPHEARSVASQIENPASTHEHIQAELERVARVM